MRMQISPEIKKKLPLIIALASGILAILLLNVYIQKEREKTWEKIKQIQQQAQVATPPQQMGIILVARRDISPQVPIIPDDLLIREVPVEFIQPGAVSSPDNVLGQIASTPIMAGEQILKTKLLPPGNIGRTLSEITPRGKRAITVSVDEFFALSGLLKPGDHVDVLALVSPPSGSSLYALSLDKTGTQEGGSKLVILPLFQDVLVLAVGSEYITPLSSSEKTKEKTQASTVTLALNPQEATLLSFVQEQGKIRMMMHSSDDVASSEPIKPVNWDTLFQYLYPRAKEQRTTTAPEQYTVEVYRGLRKEIVPLYEGEKR